MEEMMEFKNLKRVALNELRKLNAAYANKDEFAESDAKKYDCLWHGLKCQLTSEAMMEAEEGGMSGRRGRSPVTGRYVSRDGGNSYADGYSRGYSEAMMQLNGPRSISGSSLAVTFTPLVRKGIATIKSIVENSGALWVRAGAKLGLSAPLPMLTSRSTCLDTEDVVSLNCSGISSSIIEHDVIIMPNNR